MQSGILEGDIALFTCAKGYTLIGASHVTCLSTGEWSSEWPSCECEYLNNNVLYLLNHNRIEKN